MPKGSLLNRIDMTTPQARVAQRYMEHKGLGRLRPHDVEKVQGVPCWYFYYDLPEGELELEVSWEPQAGWQHTVTSFTLAGKG